MRTAYLVGHERVDVHHVVAARKVVALLIVTLAAHVGVRGVAGIEEGVVDAVLLPQREREASECGDLEARLIAVVCVVVGDGARGLEQTVRGVGHALQLVAYARRGENAECLVADRDVAAEAYVTSEFGQRRALVDREVGVEDLVRGDV